MCQSRVQIMTQKYIPIESKTEKPATAYVNSKPLNSYCKQIPIHIHFLEQAMKFLKDAIFTVGDFEAQASAIDEKDGSIINGPSYFSKHFKLVMKSLKMKQKLSKVKRCTYHRKRCLHRRIRFLLFK